MFLHATFSMEGDGLGPGGPFLPQVFPLLSLSFELVCVHQSWIKRRDEEHGASEIMEHMDPSWDGS